MAGLTFAQQLTLTLIDKAVVGGLLVFAAFGFNKLLEAFKSQQTRQLEIFKAEQARQLETFKSVYTYWKHLEINYQGEMRQPVICVLQWQKWQKSLLLLVIQFVGSVGLQSIVPRR